VNSGKELHPGVSIKCAFQPRRICRSLPAGGVCPIVSLTAAVSDIAAVSPTATNDKVERLGAESTRRTAVTHANGTSTQLFEPGCCRTPLPSSRRAASAIAIISAAPLARAREDSARAG
jgi:hypothetical protein